MSNSFERSFDKKTPSDAAAEPKPFDAADVTWSAAGAPLKMHACWTGSHLLRDAELPHPGPGWVEVSAQGDLAVGLRVYVPAD